MLHIGLDSLPIIPTLQGMLMSSYQGDDHPLDRSRIPLRSVLSTPEENEIFLNESRQLFFLSQSPKLPLAGIWNHRRRKDCMYRQNSNWDALSSELQTGSYPRNSLFSNKTDILSLLTESGQVLF